MTTARPAATRRHKAPLAALPGGQKAVDDAPACPPALRPALLELARALARAAARAQHAGEGADTHDGSQHHARGDLRAL